MTATAQTEQGQSPSDWPCFLSKRFVRTELLLSMPAAVATTASTTATGMAGTHVSTTTEVPTTTE